jgi:hypothetical protein
MSPHRLVRCPARPAPPVPHYVALLRILGGVLPFRFALPDGPLPRRRRLAAR